MGKRNRATFAMVKTLSIFNLLIFTITTVCMFFIFPKYYNSIINVFLIKNVFDTSLYLVFDSSATIFHLLFMILSLICLIISNILMFFTRFGIMFPTFLFSSDIIYQLYRIMKTTDNIPNYWYILGIIAELIAVFLMIIYFIKAKLIKQSKQQLI